MCQFLHSVTMTDNRCSSVHRFSRCNAHSVPMLVMSSRRGMHLDFAIASHNILANGHLHIAWNVSSDSNPHKTHVLVTSRFRFDLFTIVAREFVIRRHAKMRTLGGAGHPHTAFQTARVPSGALLVAPTLMLEELSMARWYAPRTKKFPCGLGA